MLVFCMEIVQGNYSNSLPNETRWVTYFPNFSFLPNFGSFLNFVSFMSRGKGLNVLPSFTGKDLS